MRRTLLVVFALAAFGACTPGTGENGQCTPQSGDCQQNLDCFLLLPDGGGICKYVCEPHGSPTCPNSSYTCVSAGYCSHDGGIY
jgi:hypothetical protein